MSVDDRFTQEEPEDQLEGVRNEIITGPVSDWATDFSHLEPEWSADPYPIQDDLRQRCPIALQVVSMPAISSRAIAPVTWFAVSVWPNISAPRR